MIGEYVFCPDGNSGYITAVKDNKVKVGFKWYVYQECMVHTEAPFTEIEL